MREAFHVTALGTVPEIIYFITLRRSSPGDARIPLSEIFDPLLWISHVSSESAVELNWGMLKAT
jgi:hypothetical protein